MWPSRFLHSPSLHCLLPPPHPQLPSRPAESTNASSSQTRHVHPESSSCPHDQAHFSLPDQPANPGSPSPPIAKPFGLLVARKCSLESIMDPSCYSFELCPSALRPLITQAHAARGKSEQLPQPIQLALQPPPLNHQPHGVSKPLRGVGHPGRQEEYL